MANMTIQNAPSLQRMQTPLSCTPHAYVPPQDAPAGVPARRARAPPGDPDSPWQHDMYDGNEDAPAPRRQQQTQQGFRL